MIFRVQFLTDTLDFSSLLTANLIRECKRGPHLSHGGTTNIGSGQLPIEQEFSGLIGNHGGIKRVI